MSGRNRSLLIALGVVAVINIIIGFSAWPISPNLNTYGEDAPRNGQYIPGGRECQPSALMGIRVTRQGPRKVDACAKEAEEYRLQIENIIQQTRAANAAEAQAVVATQQLWTGWLQTIGGFLTLAAAVGAAIYARAAAVETRKGNLQAREVLAHERFANGPVLEIIGISPYIANFLNKHSNIALRVSLKNIGRSKAYDIFASGQARVANDDWIDITMTINDGAAQSCEDGAQISLDLSAIHTGILENLSERRDLELPPLVENGANVEYNILIEYLDIYSTKAILEYAIKGVAHMVKNSMNSSVLGKEFQYFDVIMDGPAKRVHADRR